MSKPVVIERSYRATAQELWELWTTKDGFESWWGPEGFRVEVSAMEARQGGKLSYAMIADGAEQIAWLKKAGMPLSHGTHGTFTLVEPYARLRLTHVIDFLPGVAPYQNNIVVDFVPQGSDVRMIVSVDPHRDETWTQRSVEGFTSQLTKLPGALERRRHPR
jgi:uncharacterized protein YndB with AHSA1/START domain